MSAPTVPPGGNPPDEAPSPSPPAGGPVTAESTERRFLSSTLAAYGSQLGRIAVRLVADVALAHLILPDQHGLFDYALSAVLIAGVLRDFGLSYQLVRDDREPYGTVLLWSLGSGVLMVAALVALSPLFGGLDPDLPQVVAWLAPYVLLDALAAVPRVFFERRLRVGRLVVPEVLRGAAFAAVAIFLGWRGVGVWALVAGELVGMGLLAAVLWRRARAGGIPLDYEPRLLPRLLVESRYLCAIALGAFALPHIERYVLGPFVTTAMVAVYGKARLWGLRIQTIVVPAVQRVLYPTLVAYRDRPERAFGAFRIGTVTILTFEVLAAYFIYTNAPLIQRVLLGDGWEAAVPLLELLCFLPLVDPFSRLGGELLKTHHRDRTWLVIVMLNLASFLGFGLLLAPTRGAAGVALANFLLLGNLVMAWSVWRLLGPPFWRLFRDLVFLYLVPLPLFWAVARLVPEDGWLRAGASCLAALAALALLTLRFGRPFVAFFRLAADGPTEPVPPPEAETDTAIPPVSPPPTSREPPP